VSGPTAPLELSTSPWLDDLAFPEGLRWHDGRLWFADIVRESVHTARPGETANVVAHVPGRPSGLGHDGSGTLLVTSMRTRSLLRLVDGSLEQVADLSACVPRVAGDMAVDPVRGVAFVAGLGETDVDGRIVLVGRDGEPVVAARVEYPNGMVLLGDDELVVADTFRGRLLSFRVGLHGALTADGVFAELNGRRPDGCVADAEGAVWVACYTTGEFLRVMRGGRVTHRVDVGDRWALDCALGGTDGMTLFLATALTTREDFNAGRSRGWLDVAIAPAPARAGRRKEETS
jgi:sugar lactone lactonase YvrE